MVTCPNCKSPVDVPEDHVAETIRCGICWAEVEVGFRELQPVPEAAEFEDENTPPVLERVDPFANVPGRPAPGMAPLEVLLGNVCERMPHLFSAPMVKASKIIEAGPETESRRDSVPRIEEEGLRRKRGGRHSSYALAIEKKKEEAVGSWKPLFAIIGALVIFAIAILMFRFLR